MARAQYWVFTHNNPEDYEVPLRWPSNPQCPPVTYIVWQAEVGDSGTEHLQGYIVFAERVRQETLKKVDPRAHWETRRGDHEQAKHYSMKGSFGDCKCEHCEKANTILGPWEYGSDHNVPRKKGQRMDLDALKQALDDPEMELADVASNHFGAFLRYNRGIVAYLTSKVRHRNTERPQIFVFWGPSGTGKSRLAETRWPRAYRKMKNEWWQGYKGQKEVIFDDFYGWIAYDEMLRILDWYRFELQMKGSSAPLSATTFIFTSNVPWEEWYKKVYDTSALRRRIEEFGIVTHMTEPYQEQAGSSSQPVPE